MAPTFVLCELLVATCDGTTDADPEDVDCESIVGEESDFEEVSDKDWVGVDWETSVVLLRDVAVSLPRLRDRRDFAPSGEARPGDLAECNIVQ